MATTATVTVSKTEQAAKLRAELQGIEVALSKSRAGLVRAQEALGHLTAKRKKLEEDSARGVQPKPGVVASLLAEIAEAEIPVNGLTPVVAEQQARLGAVRETLEALHREIGREEAAVARQARFAELTKQGHTAADVIAGKLRTLLEIDFPALDAVRDNLIREFIGGALSTATGPEPQAARRVLGELAAKLSTGDQQTVAEIELLRATDQKKPWTVRGDTVFVVRNLQPPKK